MEGDAALSDDQPAYNLKAVVQQTGIPAASLRAWERRYAILAPIRKANGHRLYPAAEVQKLLRIKGLMAQGMTISQAAEEVRRQPEAPLEAGAATEVERLRSGLGLALSNFDVPRANQLFGALLDLLPVDLLCLRVLRPLVSTLQPFGRTYLRARVGSLLLQGPAEGPTALVMGPDPYDLEPMLVALFLSRRGHRVIYVEGTEAPAGLQPDLVVDPRQWRAGLSPEQLFG